jgi:hypothetical protein
LDETGFKHADELIGPRSRIDHPDRIEDSRDGSLIERVHRGVNEQFLGCRSPCIACHLPDFTASLYQSPWAALTRILHSINLIFR